MENELVVWRLMSGSLSVQLVGCAVVLSPFLGAPCWAVSSHSRLTSLILCKEKSPMGDKTPASSSSVDSLFGLLLKRPEQ